MEAYVDSVGVDRFGRSRVLFEQMLVELGGLDVGVLQHAELEERLSVSGRCEHERGKRGREGWWLRELRCCMRDGGLLVLQSRRADDGSKPPRGALAEDRCLERRRKRRGSDRVRCGPGR